MWYHSTLQTRESLHTVGSTACGVRSTCEILSALTRKLHDFVPLDQSPKCTSCGKAYNPPYTLDTTSCLTIDKGLKVVPFLLIIPQPPSLLWYYNFLFGEHIKHGASMWLIGTSMKTNEGFCCLINSLSIFSQFIITLVHYREIWIAVIDEPVQSLVHTLTVTVRISASTFSFHPVT